MATKKKVTRTKKAKPKSVDTPMSDRTWLELSPIESEVEKNAIGRLHIPIEKLRPLLDRLMGSTKNFYAQLYKDNYGSLCAFGVIELSVWIDGRERHVVGAYNLNIAESINGFWNGTLKSECTKNAAAELGARLGRGLNKENDIPIENATVITQVKKIMKARPDSRVMQQYLAAIERGDQEAITTLKNIYEIEPIQENHVEQEQNIGN
jgi:hypothetical protein